MRVCADEWRPLLASYGTRVLWSRKESRRFKAADGREREVEDNVVVVVASVRQVRSEERRERGDHGPL